MSGPSDASPLERPAPTNCVFQGRAERTEQAAAFKSKKSLFIQLLPALILLRNVFVHPLGWEGCAGRVHVCSKSADSAAFGCCSEWRLLRPCAGTWLTPGRHRFLGELYNPFHRPSHQDRQKGKPLIWELLAGFVNPERDLPICRWISVQDFRARWRVCESSSSLGKDGVFRVRLGS